MYYYLSKWRNDGSWKRIHDHLVGWVRVAEDKESSPSAGSVDSQTVATAVMVSDTVGYDAGKKRKGRKRFTLEGYVRVTTNGQGRCCQCP